MKRKTWLAWLPAILWMCLIFSMSHQEGGGSGRLSKMILEFLASWGLDLRLWFGADAGWVIRKMAHFTEYAILAGFLWLALRQRLTWPRLGFWTWLGTTLYAASDEFHQLFVPGRVGNVGDVAIDSLGAATMVLLLYLVYRLRQRVSAASHSR